MLKTHFAFLAALIFAAVTTTNSKAQDSSEAPVEKSATVAEELPTNEEWRDMLKGLPLNKFTEVSDNCWLLHVLCNGKVLTMIVARSPDGTRVWNTFRLAEVPSDIPAEILASHLAKLMLVNGTAGDFFFSLDDDMTVNFNGCIHVHRKISPEEYLAHLGQMAKIVVDQESLWNPSLWPREKPKHVGQWRSASGTILLNLNAADRFELKVEKSVTKGKYSLNGTKLVMIDLLGEKLEAELTLKNDGELRLTAEGEITDFTRL